MKEDESKKKVGLNGLIYFLAIINITLACIYISKFFGLKIEAVEESQLLNSIVIERQSGDGSLIGNQNGIMEKEEQQVAEEAKITDGNAEENTGEDAQSNENIESQENEEQGQNVVTERMLKVEKLQAENKDIVGWIEIEDTNINYPVLQGEDNEYYLTHNYKKETSQKGSIFLTKDYDWDLPSTNLLIYGHNIMNGQMFQNLLKYADEEFYKEHPVIRFTTQNEDKEYEIISAFKSRVFYKSEQNVFRYYDFVNAENEEEYNEFIKNAKDSSLYDIEKTAEYGDKLITLITCSYHTTDGRFVVIGREK